MARNRKKAVTKASPGEKAKTQDTPPATPAPKKSEPFPTKALVKIFQSLDVITATSFRLACHKFEVIYLSHHEEVFKHHKLPLHLETRIRYTDGTSQTLKACLKSWMPAHLVYDDFAEKFVTVDNLGKRFLEEINALEFEKKARRDWRKNMNNKKQQMIDDKRRFLEAVGLPTENMDFKWELAALGVESMELEPESDSEEESIQMAFPRGEQPIVEESM